MSRHFCVGAGLIEPVPRNRAKIRFLCFWDSSFFLCGFHFVLLGAIVVIIFVFDASARCPSSFHPPIFTLYFVLNDLDPLEFLVTSISFIASLNLLEVVYDSASFISILPLINFF
jgi:hypothetical protein